MHRMHLVLLLVTACCAGTRATAIRCEIYPVPTGTHSGSGYTALQWGPDGKVYVGTAIYGGSAHLVRFDPRAKRWDDIFNAHALTREQGAGLDSQSKFHAKIVVDGDGVVWAATKQGNEEFVNRPEYGENETGYPGGHLFAFHPRTGQVVDHGILMKQEGLMGGVCDPARKRLYYMSFPRGHLLIYDIAGNTVRDMGYAGPAARYMVIDRRGRIFAQGAGPTGAKTPYLYMYDPVTDRLSQLAVHVEGPGAGDYLDPYVLVTSREGDRLFGCAIGGKYVMDFDLASIALDRANPLANGSICCTHIPEGVPAGQAGGDQHAGALGNDGCFYFNSDHYKVDNKLLRYDPYRRVVDNLGDIELPGGSKAHGSSQGATVAPDGTLYLKYIAPYELLRFPGLTGRKGAAR